MAIKKFTPSLLGIPEEDSSSYSVEIDKPVGRRNSVISLKRENSRRRTCSGCPGCEPQDFKSLCGKLPEFPSLAACRSCASTTTETKQQSIQKWLEDIPMLKSSADAVTKPKRLRSPARSLSPDQISAPILRAVSPRPASERAPSPNTKVYENRALSVCSKTPSDSCIATKRRRRLKPICKPKAPPPPIPTSSSRGSSVKSSPTPQNRLPPPDMINEAIARHVQSDETAKIPTITKRNMNAVINEFSKHHSYGQTAEDKPMMNTIMNTVEYETDSLERSRRNKGRCTPTEYVDSSSSQPSPSMSAALPMDEEMTMRNAIFNKKTGNMTISRLNMEEILQVEDDDYELIVLKKSKDKKENTYYNLPKFLQRNNGYSLVSEVYVNNGYNFGSPYSSPTISNSSTLEKPPTPKPYEVEEKPGKLLIKVEDCPDNYLPANESDDFEPDTLDRKISRKQQQRQNQNEVFIDSLERPNQILLRSTGSFKVNSQSSNESRSNFNRNFGSLREIYEAKVRNSIQSYNGSFKEKSSTKWALSDKKSEDGRILTLEERHSKRQRRSSPSVPPDVIPPPPHNSSPIYEHPKPPRKVIMDGLKAPFSAKPPLPPKNGYGRSTGRRSPPKDKVVVTTSDTEIGASDNECKNTTHVIGVAFKNGVNHKYIYPSNNLDQPLDASEAKKVWRKFCQPKPDDSGYLSTDSNEGKSLKHVSPGGGSETDESLGDAHSESGAESVETHSVFFGSFRKRSCLASSMDSGVGSEFKIVDPTLVTVITDDSSSTDSETISYRTVVPFGSISTRNSFIIKQ